MVVLNENVPQFSVPTQPELAVKLVLVQLEHDDELMQYFDTDRIGKGKFPEKAFFWGIMHTVRKDLTQALINEVMDRRARQDQVSREQQSPVQFQQIWLEKLLEFPSVLPAGGASSRHTNLLH